MKLGVVLARKGLVDRLIDFFPSSDDSHALFLRELQRAFGRMVAFINLGVKNIFPALRCSDAPALASSVS